jgi:hypothetical protein
MAFYGGGGGGGGRITPPTSTGGEEEFISGLQKAETVLGHVIGFGIFFFTVSLLVLELALNPIFIFAQAKNNGVEIGAPFVSLSWWIVILITFATTGLQYALLKPGHNKRRLGYVVGWAMAILDTLMDGAGFSAYVAGGSPTNFSGDASHLVLGIFPEQGSGLAIWAAYGFICFVCLLHEPFLNVVLGRLHFEPSLASSNGPMVILKWTERAGKLHNRVALVAIVFAPYIMLSLDMLLFPKSVQGQSSIIQTIFFVMTVAITLVGIVGWEYWNHLVQEGKYKLKNLDRKHQGIFVAIMLVTIVDSVGDQAGMNQILFGRSWPQQSTMGNMTSFLVTSALVMLMCTFFEPLNSHVIMDLVSRVAPGLRPHSSLVGGGGPSMPGMDPLGPSPLGPDPLGPSAPMGPGGFFGGMGGGAGPITMPPMGPSGAVGFGGLNGGLGNVDPPSGGSGGFPPSGGSKGGFGGTDAWA